MGVPKLQCGEVCPTALWRNTIARNNIISTYIYVSFSWAVAKMGCGSCQTLVWQPPKSGLAAWQLPRSGLAAATLWFGSWAAATLGFGSCQTRVWQLPNQCLAAAKPEATRVWQLPNMSVPAAESGFGRRYISNIKRQSANQFPHILLEIKINTMTWDGGCNQWGEVCPHRTESAQYNINLSVCRIQRLSNYIKVDPEFQ